MKQEARGIFTLFLVAGIAITMLLAFGVRAIDTATACEVSPIQCKYSGMIISARAYPQKP